MSEWTALLQTAGVLHFVILAQPGHNYAILWRQRGFLVLGQQAFKNLISPGEFYCFIPLHAQTKA